MQLTAIATVFACATTAVLAAGKTHNGPATYFYQEDQTGSCGQVHKVILPNQLSLSTSNSSQDSDYIVAISQQAPFKYNAHCGQTVTIKNTGGGDSNSGVGKSITATVADTCPECVPDHLDLSTGAFKALTGGTWTRRESLTFNGT